MFSLCYSAISATKRDSNSCHTAATVKELRRAANNFRSSVKAGAIRLDGETITTLSLWIMDDAGHTVAEL